MKKKRPKKAKQVDEGQEIVIEAVVESVTESADAESINGWETVDTKEKSENVESKVVEVENVESVEDGSNPSMLYRHPTNKLVGGVCGGIADFLGWDPVLVRILWIVATFATGGGGFLAYIALLMLLPVGTRTNGQQRPAVVELNERSLGMAAYVLIGIGVLWLVGNLPFLGWLWNGFWALVGTAFWPVLLIGAGFLLLNRNGNRSHNWRASMQQAGSRFRSGVSSKMPSRGNMRDGMSKARSYVPLRRSKSNRVVFGVCGGIGNKLGIDANLVRLIWAAFTFASLGIGGLGLYAVATLIIPEESAVDAAISQDVTKVAQDIDSAVQA